MDKPKTVQDIAQVYLEKHSQPRGNRMGDEAVLRAPLMAFGAIHAHCITHDDIDRYVTRREVRASPVTP